MPGIKINNPAKICFGCGHKIINRYQNAVYCKECYEMHRLIRNCINKIIRNKI